MPRAPLTGARQRMLTRAPVEVVSTPPMLRTVFEYASSQ